MIRRFVWGLCTLVGLSALGGLHRASAIEVLVSSRDSNEIYKFDLETRVGTPFITGAASGLSGPVGMRYGPDGNLYVSNFFNDQIRKYDGQTGAPLGVFATTGLAAPSDLRFGPDGNLYVANYNDTTVVRFDGQTGQPLAADAGKAFASGGDLAQGTSLKFKGNDLYVSSWGSDYVLKYDITQSTPAPASVFADTTSLATASGFSPAGLIFGQDGNVYVSGLLGQTVGVFSNTGQPIRQFTMPDYTFPSDLLQLPDGKLLVASTGLNGVFAFDPLTGQQIPVPSDPFGLYLANPGIAIAGQLAFVPIPGDATDDAVVDAADYTIWADHFLQTSKFGAAGGDFNFDGKIDGADYTLWADNFAPYVPSASLAVVPEPSSLALALWGLLGAAGIARKRIAGARR